MDISYILENKWIKYKTNIDNEDINNSKNILTSNIKIYILNELNSINFIKKDLVEIINKYDYYNIITYNNITIKYISIKELTIKRMKKVIYRLGYIAKLFNISKAINIWFIPCKCKRFFPNNDEIIDRKHINGGYTYINSTDIYVYRYEDYAKVLIHELLHHSILQTNFSDKQLTRLNKEFKINNSNNLEPSEAIIEFWALLMHLKCISKEYSISFNKLYKTEVIWNIYLSNKIIDKHNNNILWKENTPSYSYIYFKTILLLNFMEFIKIKVPYNDIEFVDYLIKNKDLPVIAMDKFKKKILELPNKIKDSLRLSRSGNL